MRVHAAIAGVAVFLALAAQGCGPGRDPHGRSAITGEVTFQGAPLDGGSIKFLPVDDKGQSAGALIREGKYQIPREQGLPAGMYRVEISALEPTPTPTGAPGSEPAPPAKERVAAEFNTKTTLKIEVKSDQPNQFDFQVK